MRGTIAVERSRCARGMCSDSLWREAPVRCVHVIPMRFIELNGKGAQGSLQGYWSPAT